MPNRSFFFLPLLALTLTAFGCAGPKAAQKKSASNIADPIQVQSAELAVALIRISAEGDEGTLIEDPGWREYVLKIENLSDSDLTVQNVKLLSVNGRYLDSASDYSQITAPPDVGAEVAGDVAETAAGIAAGQVIPFGGTIISVISSASSTTSAASQANANREFRIRSLKNVELAPSGMVKGSAFLPNITGIRSLLVVYAQEDRKDRIEIPLPIRSP